MNMYFELRITGRAQSEAELRAERARCLPLREVLAPAAFSLYRGRQWHRFTYYFNLPDFVRWKGERGWQPPNLGHWRGREVPDLPQFDVTKRLKKPPFLLSLAGFQEKHLSRVQTFFLQDLFRLYGLSRAGLLYHHKGSRVTVVHNGFRDRLLINEIGHNFAQVIGARFEVSDAP